MNIASNHALVDAASKAKGLGNVWMVAAHDVLQTLGLLPGGDGQAGDRRAPLVLYLDPDGTLTAHAECVEAPPTSTYVCRLAPGAEVCVVAARLRHAANRFRLADSRIHEDND